MPETNVAKMKLAIPVTGISVFYSKVFSEKIF